MSMAWVVTASKWFNTLLNSTKRVLMRAPVVLILKFSIGVPGLTIGDAFTNYPNQSCSPKQFTSALAFVEHRLKQLDSKLSPVKGFMGSNPLSMKFMVIYLATILGSTPILTKVIHTV